MVGEAALIGSAGGDFVATMAAVLALFIMGIFAYFIRWVMVTVPDQMQRDRMAITTRMASDTAAICAKLGEMLERMKDTENTICKHDDQARKILEIDTRMEATLGARPCQANR